jgi:nitric oxide reductase large subunit
MSCLLHWHLWSSAAEVIPLTILTFESWSFVQLGAQQEERSKTTFPHFWAVMFLSSVGFWNFLGAGIFGFLINLPIVSYYEIGTALTANHAHASMMGVYGMLSVGHRGISLSLLLLAELLLVAEMIRHQRTTELLFLGFLLVPITLLETQLASAFFAARAGLRDSAEWR